MAVGHLGVEADSDQEVEMTVHVCGRDASSTVVARRCPTRNLLELYDPRRPAHPLHVHRLPQVNCGSSNIARMWPALEMG